jgi:glycosyltransferase involved in cell wall biosynthesis
MKKTESILISIIIPCFNAEPFVSECINSILHQTYPHIEVIVINDNSSDNSFEILTGLSKADERIKLKRHDSLTNLGPSVCRNIGITSANGKFILFVDADDSLAPDAVEVILKAQQKNDTDLVVCGYKELFRDGSEGTHIDFQSIRGNATNKNMALKALHGTGGVVWGKLYKKQIIDQYSIEFNPLVKMCEDIGFNLTYILRAKSFNVINKYLYTYNRRNESSITNNLDDLEFKRQFELQIEINKLLQKFGFSKNEIQHITYVKMSSHLNGHVNRIFNNSLSYKNTKTYFDNVINIITDSDCFKCSQKSTQDKIITSVITTKQPYLVYLMYLLIYKTRHSAIRAVLANIKRYLVK